MGVQQQPLCSYNSASTLRVRALRSIGGFPAEFWLDFMDHAVFHALFIRDYRVYVMLATLTHDFSHANHQNLPLWRLLNILRSPHSPRTKKRQLHGQISVPHLAITP